MAIKIKLLIMLTFFMSFIFTATSRVNSGDISWWCNQTPYPEPCKFHMNQGPWKSASYSAFSSISRIQFRNMAIQVAMNHGVDALKYHIKWPHPKWQSHQEKAAWNTCMRLHNNTIFQFKKTLFSYVHPTPSDIQTWLSAALTNLHACQSGYFKFNNTNDLAQLISNILAINRVPLSTEEDESTNRNDFGFPSWLLEKDQVNLQYASVVVAQDGSGNFQTIQEALNVSDDRGGCERFVIYVKRGIYNEYIEIGENMRKITMVGDGAGATIITGSRSNASGYSTYDSATFKVLGDGFIAFGITFQNTAGPENGQAVALLSSSDCSAFYLCSFEGYQDTLCVYSQRQFYKNCGIYGSVDFIFGNAAVVLQNCYIYARPTKPGDNIIITAQGRNDPNQNTGISIMNSWVTAAPELAPLIGRFKVYLGRPWEHYARVVYMETFLDSLVDHAGWLKWDDNQTSLSTLFYGEYKNTGPGSFTQGRVSWSGYKLLIDDSTAQSFTVANLIDGNSWLPNTGVPFISGLG